MTNLYPPSLIELALRPSNDIAQLETDAKAIYDAIIDIKELMRSHSMYRKPTIKVGELVAETDAFCQEMCHPFALDDDGNITPPYAIRSATGADLVRKLIYQLSIDQSSALFNLASNQHRLGSYFTAFIGRDLHAPSGGNSLYVAISITTSANDRSATLLLSVGLYQPGFDAWVVACTPDDVMKTPCLCTAPKEIGDDPQYNRNRTFPIDIPIDGYGNAFITPVDILRQYREYARSIADKVGML